MRVNLSQEQLRLMTLLLCAIGCVFAFSSAVIAILTPVEDESDYIFEDNVEHLPQYFAVPQIYDTPTKSSNNTFAATKIALYEAFYRKQAIEADKILEDEYISFSEQSLNCTNNVCTGKLLPSKCDNCREGIKFTETIGAHCVSSHGIKELLYSSNAPVMLTMPEPLAAYYIPCSDARVSGTTECTSKSIPCPESDGYCGLLRFHSYTENGEFRIPNTMHPGAPMSFLLVGYTNTYTGSTGYAVDPGMTQAQGGFIAKKFGGFPITHYLGLIRPSNVYSQCYHGSVPYLWNGANISCIRNAKAFDKSCITYETLKCINSKYCEVDSNYALMKLPVRTDDTRIVTDAAGMTVTPMFKKAANGEVSEIQFDKLPFHRLNEAFALIENYETFSEHCGNWFIPYEIIDKLNTLNGGFENRVRALQMTIEFEDSSIYGNVKDKALANGLKASKQKVEPRQITQV